MGISSVPDTNPYRQYLEITTDWKVVIYYPTFFLVW
jgi:hypothetical protein